MVPSNFCSSAWSGWIISKIRPDNHASASSDVKSQSKESIGSSKFFATMCTCYFAQNREICLTTVVRKRQTLDEVRDFVATNPESLLPRIRIISHIIDATSFIWKELGHYIFYCQMWFKGLPITLWPLSLVSFARTAKPLVWSYVSLNLDRFLEPGTSSHLVTSKFLPLL